MTLCFSYYQGRHHQDLDQCVVRDAYVDRILAAGHPSAFVSALAYFAAFDACVVHLLHCVLRCYPFHETVGQRAPCHQVLVAVAVHMAHHTPSEPQWAMGTTDAEACLSRACRPFCQIRSLMFGVVTDVIHRS